jgi:hypothetical protein
MQSTIRYQDALPLQGESGFSRRIFIDSCKLDDEHLQIRGELVDNRADFEQIEKEIAVHGMVVRLTLNANTRKIVKSEMALPQMAFPGICMEQMPAKAEELEDTQIGKAYTQKVAEVFGATRGCMHLMTLYRAIGVAMNQVTCWNHSFPFLDSDCPAESVGNAMSAIEASVLNSCHAWQQDTGGVCRDFATETYEPMLERCAPNLLGRWKQYMEEQN